MRFFPESTLLQLEFGKVKDLLAGHCRTDYGRAKSLELRLHTRLEYIEAALQQANEFKTLLAASVYFPNDFNLNVSREITLLGIPGATLDGSKFLLIRKLLDNTANIFRWFDAERREAYPALSKVIEGTWYEKAIRDMIDEVLDESGFVKDDASEDLARIRMNLYRKRNELRRVFDRIVSKMNKLGYLSDIEESFMNGRRVLAVFAEQKREVKGILHAESDSRRTSFIEPEETTELNNEVYSLEHEETREVNRILRELTQKVGAYAALLKTYLTISGEFDFIRAKARLAIDIGGNYPMVKDRAHIGLINAYHPLLLLYNNRNGKATVPVNLTLHEKERILVISGPNAGGKTVTLKTVGLLQVMLQAGLLVSVSPDSEMGIFKQMFIHIGDTQSLEFELSTYSSHLKNMKYFIENANGKTLFFIDELGSGSDPNLGGAFAEVIMEELAMKHAYGIVTTHYLNLKVMANKVPGIINGAMQFDEQNLLPLYRLQTGKPGSSYTFSIAERIGLDKRLISKARKLADESHFQLDKLLNSTEQDLQKLEKEKKALKQLMEENTRLKKEMQHVMDKERHRQELEILKQQNRITDDKLAYLRDMERRLKAMVIEWRKTEDKDAVVKMIHALLFGQKERFTNEKRQKKLDEKFIEVGGEITVGSKVRMKNSRTVGQVKELRGKNAILQVGVIPITVALKDLVVIIDKPTVPAS